MLWMPLHLQVIKVIVLSSANLVHFEEITNTSNWEENKVTSSFCQGLGYVSALQFLQLCVLKKWSQSVPWVLDKWSDVKKIIYIYYTWSRLLPSQIWKDLEEGAEEILVERMFILWQQPHSCLPRNKDIRSDSADQQTLCPVTQQKTTFKTSDATQCHTATQNNTGTPSSQGLS